MLKEFFRALILPVFCIGTLSACGGGSEPPVVVTPPPVVVTPPPVVVTPPPAQQVSPLSLPLKPATFTYGVANHSFVLNNTLFVTDQEHYLHRQNADGKWQKLNVRTSNLYSAGGYLIADKGMRSSDNGDSWQSTSEDIFSLLLQHPQTGDLYAGAENWLYSSNDAGASWQRIAEFNQSISSAAPLADNTLMVRTLQSGLYRLDTLTLQQTELEAPGLIVHLTQRSNGDIIAVGSRVFLSRDQGNSWIQMPIDLGYMPAWGSIEVRQIAGNYYIAGGYNALLKITADDTLVNISPAMNIGGIIDVAEKDGQFYLATYTGVYSASLTALQQDNRLIDLTPIGVPTSDIYALFNTPYGEFYHFNYAQSGLLQALHSDTRLHTGEILIRSVFDAPSGKLGVVYFSNTEQAFDGLGYFDMATGQFELKLLGYTATRLEQFAGKAYVHYGEAPPSAKANWVLQSDDMNNWQPVELPAAVMQVFAIAQPAQCQQLQLLAKSADAVQVLSAAPAEASLNWQSSNNMAQAKGIVASGQRTVVFADKALWLRDDCSSDYQHLDLTSNLTGNISTVQIRSNEIWFGTTDGELWRYDAGKFYQQKVTEQRIRQLYFAADSTLYVVAESLVWKTE